MAAIYFVSFCFEFVYDAKEGFPAIWEASLVSESLISASMQSEETSNGRLFPGGETGG
jgi:hypothetical protein